MLIDIIFRFIHLAILLVIAIYFLKKYYLADAKQAIKLENELIDNLKIKTEELALKIEDEEQRIQEQKVHLAFEDEKINFWKQEFFKHEALRLAEQKENAQKLQERLDTQVKNFLAIKTLGEVVKIAKAEILKELQDKLSKNNEVNLYFDKIIKYVEKN